MISAIVLTKNEEKNIKDCLKSLSFADEIIVIDDYSQDRTREIAKKMGARVFKRSLNEDFASQRNFGLDKANSKWVLFVDADERVSEKLRDEIIQITANPFIEKCGFFIKRRDFLWGKELRYGEVGRIKLLRLACKDSGKWVRRVHEKWRVVGRTGTLNNPINHHPHASLREFLLSINRLSTLHARANKEEGKKSSLVKIIFWPLGHFLVNFFVKKGFLDKTPGFMVAMMMSFHSFLSWSKLWILQRS
jgi:glycosyltransferase involved in cell wall biosynthesis